MIEGCGEKYRLSAEIILNWSAKEKQCYNVSVAVLPLGFLHCCK